MSSKKIGYLALFREKVTLYGWGITLMIILKTISQKLVGFYWEKYCLLARELDDLPTLPQENFAVRELSIHDYENSLWEPSFLDPIKKRLYLERFANPKAKAYGAFVDGQLAFSSWVLIGEIIIQNHFRFQPSKMVGLLLDAYCHPNFRRRGLHNFINVYRLHKIKMAEAEKACVVIWAYNRPSIKTQIKNGFHTVRKFHIIHFWNKKWCTLKTIPL